MLRFGGCAVLPSAETIGSDVTSIEATIVRRRL
jgi:hypothetical protein